MALARSKKIEAATNSYIDDILVDESQVKAMELTQYLSNFGLVTKPPEPLNGGATLGLKIRRDRTEELVFCRGHEMAIFQRVSLEGNCIQHVES